MKADPVKMATLTLALALMLAGCRAGPPAPDGATPPPAGENGSPISRLPPEKPNSPPSPPLPAPPASLPVTPPRISLEPAPVLQGDMVVLTFDRPVDGAVTVKVEGLHEQPRLFRVDGRPTALIGIPAAARAGSYPVTVTWGEATWSGALEVLPKRFTEDRLIVTEEQTAIYYDPRQAEEWKRVFAARSQSEPDPLWRGPFWVPLAGDLKITTYFGEIRFVNGVETGRHSGMDFGAPTGTPILAPARGKVVLAERLIVTGWTLIIDHGLNLYTTYYHCDQINVAPGDWVEPGQVVGTVGNTGFSTGPHLHWTATVGNTPVDPWPLTQGPVLGIEPLSNRFPAELAD